MRQTCHMVGRLLCSSYLYASAPSHRAQQLRRLCARVMELAQIQVVDPLDAPADADSSSDEEEGAGAGGPADADADSSSEEEEGAGAAGPAAADADSSSDEEEGAPAPAPAAAASSGGTGAMDTGGDVSCGEEEEGDVPQPRVFALRQSKPNACRIWGLQRPCG